LNPGLKRFLVAPSRYQQPLAPRVGRSKQLDALGTFLVVDRAGLLGKPGLKLAPGTATSMVSILMIVMFRSDQTRPRQSGQTANHLQAVTRALALGRPKRSAN